MLHLSLLACVLVKTNISLLLLLVWCVTRQDEEAVDSPFAASLRFLNTLEPSCQAQSRVAAVKVSSCFTVPFQFEVRLLTLAAVLWCADTA
jgi:hypothetical protein